MKFIIYNYEKGEVLKGIIKMEKNDLLLNLINFSLCNEKNDGIHIEKCDEDKIYTEAMEQTILGILSPILEKGMISDNRILEMWKMQVFRQVFIYHNILKEQNSIVKKLQEENILCVIMKGAAAAINYPKPELRTMGDVDLLVKRSDYEKAYNIMLKSGYVLVEDDVVDYHSAFEKNGVLFELHNCVSGVEKDNNYEYLCELFEKGIDKSENVFLDGYDFPMLPKLQNGLVLLLHIKHHLLGGLGLRQIIDWMLFVNKTLDDNFWSNEFQPVLKRINMEHFAIVVTKMCQLKLGLSSSVCWCKKATNKICDDFMNYIFNMGNFGHKAQKTQSRDDVVHGSKTVIKMLQMNGCLNWELSKRVKVLKIFAWLWQICFYIRLTGVKACFNRAYRALKESK